MLFRSDVEQRWLIERIEEIGDLLRESTSVPIRWRIAVASQMV